MTEQLSKSTLTSTEGLLEPSQFSAYQNELTRQLELALTQVFAQKVHNNLIITSSKSIPNSSHHINATHRNDRGDSASRRSRPHSSSSRASRSNSYSARMLASQHNFSGLTPTPASMALTDLDDSFSSISLDPLPPYENILPLSQQLTSPSLPARRKAFSQLREFMPGDLLSSQHWDVIARNLCSLLDDSDPGLARQCLLLHVELFRAAVPSVQTGEVFVNIMTYLVSFFSAESALKPSSEPRKEQLSLRRRALAKPELKKDGLGHTGIGMFLFQAVLSPGERPSAGSDSQNSSTRVSRATSAISRLGLGSGSTGPNTRRIGAEPEAANFEHEFYERRTGSYGERRRAGHRNSSGHLVLLDPHKASRGSSARSRQGGTRITGEPVAPVSPELALKGWLLRVFRLVLINNLSKKFTILYEKTTLFVSKTLLFLIYFVLPCMWMIGELHGASTSSVLAGLF